MKLLTRGLAGGIAALVLTTGFGTVAGAAPVAQEGLVNLNLTGVTAQLPIDLAANLCDVAVDVLVSELEDGSAPCEASSNADAVVTTEDGGPVAQEGLVNVNVTDVVVQAPISVVANVCDVTVAVLVSRLQDAASPCDATGTAEAITATEDGPPAEAPVEQEGLVNLNLTGVTVQLPIALAADLCDVTVDVFVNELSDGSAPCEASSNSDAVVTTEDGGPVAQEGLVNVNVTDVVVQAPIAIAANVCDVTVAVLVSRLRRRRLAVRRRRHRRSDHPRRFAARAAHRRGRRTSCPSTRSSRSCLSTPSSTSCPSPFPNSPSRFRPTRKRSQRRWGAAATGTWLRRPREGNGSRTHRRVREPLQRCYSTARLSLDPTRYHSARGHLRRPAILATHSDGAVAADRLGGVHRRRRRPRLGAVGLHDQQPAALPRPRSHPRCHDYDPR